MSSSKYKNTCDPKYYGSGINNCGNKIKGLEKLNITEGDKDED